jgi:hypothetical protein
MTNLRIWFSDRKSWLRSQSLSFDIVCEKINVIIFANYIQT